MQILFWSHSRVAGAEPVCYSNGDIAAYACLRDINPTQITDPLAQFIARHTASTLADGTLIHAYGYADAPPPGDITCYEHVYGDDMHRQICVPWRYARLERHHASPHVVFDRVAGRLREQGAVRIVMDRRGRSMILDAVDYTL